VYTSMENGVRVQRVWVYAAQGAGVARIANYLSFMAFSILGLIRADRPTHIFIESPPLTTALPGILYARLCRARVILNVADLWPDAAVEIGALSNRHLRGLSLRLERWAYRHADIVNYVTEGVRIRLLEKGVPEAKLLPLPNGVNLSLFEPCDVPSDRPVRFLYAGTIGLNHGAEVLLHAAASCEASGTPIDLLFVGDGSDRIRLQEKALELALHNVRFESAVPIEKLAEKINRCHAGVVSITDLPTTRGGRPSKMFPFLAVGRPILFSGLGEGADIVTRYGAGLTAPNIAADTAVVMRELAGASDMQLAEFAAGARRAATDFDWSSIVGAWHDELLNRLA
jgi:colanic acid biosynthesis glycosyl transferase WcaI